MKSLRMGATIEFSSVPFPLTPSGSSDWDLDAVSGRISVRAAAHTDIFIDPSDATQVNAETLLNAPTLLGPIPAGDFRFTARVSADFASTFDAGVLLLWLDEGHWGKLCLEVSPNGEPMIVSVVAREVADDANAFVVDGGSAWLRVSRTGRVYAYHASRDGGRWEFVRAFVLDSPDRNPPRLGFEAQSPMGDGCQVSFDDIRFETGGVDNLRDGS